MKSRVVDIFLDLVKIDSPSGNEHEVAKYIINFLNKIGIEAGQDKYGNVIGHILGNGEPIIIAAHMDTVEPGRGVKPIIENGIIKSDGTTILGADNKSWIAAVLDSASHASRNIDLVFTKEEETHDGGSSHLDLRMLRAKRGFSCDDGSPLGAIFIQSPYYIKIDLFVIGKEAHAAEPEKANNALKAASEAITLLPMGEIGDKTIRNIGIMKSGRGRNTIPGMVELIAEIRSFSKINLAYATAEMIKLFNDVAKLHNCTIRKHVELENPGFEVALEDKTLLEAEQALIDLGIRPRFEVTYGCFDANYFINRGINIVNLSDGSEDNHTNRERISIANLNKLKDLAQRLMI